MSAIYTKYCTFSGKQSLAAVPFMGNQVDELHAATQGQGKNNLKIIVMWKKMSLTKLQ